MNNSDLTLTWSTNRHSHNYTKLLRKFQFSNFWKWFCFEKHRKNWERCWIRIMSNFVILSICEKRGRIHHKMVIFLTFYKFHKVKLKIKMLFEVSDRKKQRISTFLSLKFCKPLLKISQFCLCLQWLTKPRRHFLSTKTPFHEKKKLKINFKVIFNQFLFIFSQN